MLMSLPVEISLQCEVEVFVNALGKQGRGHVTCWGLHFVHTKIVEFLTVSCVHVVGFQPQCELCARRESPQSSKTQPLNTIPCPTKFVHSENHETDPVCLIEAGRSL